MTELLYQLALTRVPQIGDVQARILVNQLGSASEVFRTNPALLEKIEGIGTVRANAIARFNNFKEAEGELRFIERNGIRALFLTDAGYPHRLHHCYDAPAMLFFKGEADLNASRMLAVVGTRKNTAYGKSMTESLIAGLAANNVTIVSGLAYGIDAIAHRAALQNGLPTIGAVGHSLDQIYPADHASLAASMLGTGGILSEFFSGTGPDRHHFPLRNRIVAGITDATVVIETHINGGSMITAKLADSYNRDVFAFPGKVTDLYSSGCNQLIQHNKAMLLSDPAQLLTVLGWNDDQPVIEKKQKTLFPELGPDEQALVDLLVEGQPIHIDTLRFRSGLSASSLASAILNLELQHVVQSMPGKMYMLA